MSGNLVKSRYFQFLIKAHNFQNGFSIFGINRYSHFSISGIVVMSGNLVKFATTFCIVNDPDFSCLMKAPNVLNVVLERIYF
jgi:hypothetical protein